MIVLDGIERQLQRVVLRDVPGAADLGAEDLESVESALARLGVLNVDLDVGNGQQDADFEGFRTRCEVTDDWLEYVITLPHREDMAQYVAMYASLTLATSGCRNPVSMAEVRLAVYELCLNTLEHGRSSDPHPQIEIGLRFGASTIEGWIEDACEPFNPLEHDSGGADQKVWTRARRGYGLMIVRKVLDELKYEYTGRGNRISFSKRITP